MAKVITTALIQEIRGRVRGDVFQMWRGIQYIRNGPKPRQPRSEKQSFSRRALSDFSSKWWDLPSFARASWDYYAEGWPSPVTGFNCYIGNNLALLAARHANLTGCSGPREVPAFPVGVSGQGISYNSSLQEISLSWSYPNSADVYVQAFFSPTYGFRDDLFPIDVFLATTLSNRLILYHRVDQYQSGTYLRYWLRVISTYGESSARSSILLYQKP